VCPPTESHLWAWFSRGTPLTYKEEHEAKEEEGQEGLLNVIVLTAWRRPDYLRQTLEALSACEGFAHETLIALDGDPDPRCRDVVYGWGKWEAHLLESRTHLGCNLNTHRALQVGFDAFDGTEYVIFLEEDHVLTPDALNMFAWARDAYRDDPDIFTVSSFAMGPGDPSKFHRRPFFSPAGAWATWADRWADMDEWWMRNQHQETFPWDTWLNRNVLNGRHEIGPHLSRCRNIGEKSSLEAPIVRPGAHADVYANSNFCPYYQGPYIETDPWTP
jgi:hypothetical protein